MPALTACPAACRQKLKTPLIAGSVCGGVMGIAWIIGFTIYFRKRYKHKQLKRKIAAGKAVQKQKPSKVPEEKVVVPPDPAILLGHRMPGEQAFRNDSDEELANGDVERHAAGGSELHPSLTRPLLNGISSTAQVVEDTLKK
ncbi:hypothetical protein DXG03_001398 [Asterophora parasitica]|uniref:Uncharacterized protein n=1 Tax=Asterophora parasitica TaxID=117018 RepID=A0A9P7GE51_9AGAR|nr:hypothetical protein DXG03_001398 [Asterophora parasitica]